MTDNHNDNHRPIGRRQVLGGGVLAAVAGATAMLFPELGANAAARRTNAEAAQAWYHEEPVSQTELDAAEAAAEAERLTSAAATSSYARALAHMPVATDAKAADRVMADGRRIRATGYVTGATTVHLVWEESLADGSEGRSSSLVYTTGETTATLAAVGSVPSTVKAVAAPAAECAPGTHPVYQCVEMPFDAFMACCGGCVVAFVGSPAAGLVCAAVVCSSCYSANCKRWGNICVVNS